MSNVIFFPFPPAQLRGAIAVYVFAVLAALALIFVASRVIRLAIRRYWSKSLSEPSLYILLHTQIGQYAACLITAMFFNTLAGILSVSWLAMRGIKDGSLCRGQALVMALGNFSAGFFTVAITVHTFRSLVLRKRQSALICRLTIAVGWGLSILMATIPLAIRTAKGTVYGPDGLVCGVRSVFPKLQFILHLLPILLASLFSAFLYSLIFLVLRGTIAIRGGIKFNLNPVERWANIDNGDESYRRFVFKLASSMLWYPVAYIALLIPYAMTRMFAISGFAVPFEAMVFSFVCLYLLSVVDIQLLHLTFQVLGPAFEGASTRNTLNDFESFCSGSPVQGQESYSARSLSERTTSSLRFNNSLTRETSPSDASPNNSPLVIGGSFTHNIHTPMATLGSMHEASPGTRTVAPAPTFHLVTPFADLSLDHQLPSPRAVIHSARFESSTTPAWRQQHLLESNRQPRRPMGGSLPLNPRLPRFPPPTTFRDRPYSSRAAVATFRTRPPS